MSSDSIVIQATDISKRYEVYPKPKHRLAQMLANGATRMLRWAPRSFFEEYWALHTMSVTIRAGERIGVVGRNGAGKSTLLQLLCSTLSPTTGDVQVNGRISALLELGTGFNPDYTGRENIYVNAQILGMSRGEIDQRYDEIVAFANIGDYVDLPVRTYSSGMVVRLAFSVAIHASPQILVVDEALAVGDMAFQRKCLAWMERFTDNGGTLLFVSHTPEQVRRLCNRAIYLAHGRLVADGDAKSVCDMYERDALPTPVSSKLAADAAPALAASVAARQPFAECAVHYGSPKARIISAWTEGQDGVPRMSFAVGDSIVWRYVVTFGEDCRDVVFGFSVKSKEGIVLYATNSLTMGDAVASFVTGSEIVVTFSIIPHLGPGEYLLNCGVGVEGDDGHEFFHRVVDAATFTVAPVDRRASGLIDMQASFAEGIHLAMGKRKP